ncbi:hypothetical protein [Streptomyces canus]|nr:hypothetical protein [Streptomyces canus]MDQ0765977.1 hypothetical protein [Streptomyces canus]
MAGAPFGQQDGGVVVQAAGVVVEDGVRQPAQGLAQGLAAGRTGG